MIKRGFRYETPHESPLDHRPGAGEEGCPSRAISFVVVVIDHSLW
jgi:hypothetical protein